MNDELTAKPVTLVIPDGDRNQDNLKISTMPNHIIN